MTVKTSTASKAAALNGQLALLGANSKVKIYAGAEPAGPSTALTTQTLLSTHNMAATPFATTSTATATANAIAQATAVASGTASFYRIEDGSSVVHRQGSIGLSGSGADLIFDDVEIASGDIVSISSFTVTQA